jgi:hypothetical protein
MFYAGGRRYHLFENRFVGCRALFQPLVNYKEGYATRQRVERPAEIVTRPFVLPGTALELNLSTDASGGARVELLDGQGTPIPGYTLGDMLGRVAGSRHHDAYGGRMWTYNSELFGDGAGIRPAWGYLAPPPAAGAKDKPYLTSRWDIGDLKGKTIRVRLVFHGADLFALRTPDRPRQSGEPYPIQTSKP